MQTAVQADAHGQTASADKPFPADILAPLRNCHALLPAALSQLVRAWGEDHDAEPCDVIDELLAEIDIVLSRQVSAILHDQDFMELERIWRELEFLTDRLSRRSPVHVQFLNASKEDLSNDFEDASEIVRSGLYFHIYVSQYGQYGGEPAGAIIGSYSFCNRPDDLRLLSKIAAVASMAHAPFIAAADKSFFGIRHWKELPALHSLKNLFEMPSYASWNAFRASEDARYTALTLPRFLLRAPWSQDAVTSFTFMEDADECSLCWGNAAFAFASRLAASFERYHWCVNIVGEEDGLVPNLPSCCFETMGVLQRKIPLEVLLSEQREFDLSEAGFIALTILKGSENCAFFSACSCQSPLTSSSREDEEYVRSYNVSRQLPYLFLITRLAHYIKIIQREYIGLWKGAPELERELNIWISQYVTTMSDPDVETRARRPFSMASVTVRETDNDIGWYTVELRLRPHFRYMGMNFTLTLTGKLDKSR